MEKFVADQKQLLSLERDAELEESRLLKANVSLRDLCQKGVAIQRLVVGGQATGLYGRLVLTMVSRVHKQELAAHTITSGDIVELRPPGPGHETRGDQAHSRPQRGRELPGAPLHTLKPMPQSLPSLLSP